MSCKDASSLSFAASDRLACGRPQQSENAALMDAIECAEKGQIDANLGGGVIKLADCADGTGEVARIPHGHSLSAGGRAVFMSRRYRLGVCLIGWLPEGHARFRPPSSYLSPPWPVTCLRGGHLASIPWLLSEADSEERDLRSEFSTNALRM